MVPVRGEGFLFMRYAAAVRRERRWTVANMSFRLQKLSRRIFGVAIVPLRMVVTI